MKEEILNLFFNENLSQSEIAKELNVTKGYVSQIVTKDTRYIEYKEEKLRKSKQRHNKQIQELTKEKRKKLQFADAVSDLILKKMHDQASIEMSQAKHLSNESFRKWNYSAYKYCPSKHRYEFDEQLVRPYDVPKYIKERW